LAAPLDGFHFAGSIAAVAEQTKMSLRALRLDSNQRVRNWDFTQTNREINQWKL
jgi:hypothetical protein